MAVLGLTGPALEQAAAKLAAACKACRRRTSLTSDVTIATWLQSLAQLRDSLSNVDTTYRSCLQYSGTTNEEEYRTQLQRFIRALDDRLPKTELAQTNAAAAIEVIRAEARGERTGPTEEELAVATAELATFCGDEFVDPAWGRFEGGGNNWGLSATTKNDIVLVAPTSGRSWNLGKFRIHFILDHVARASALGSWTRITPLTPCYGDEAEEVCHPHVKENRLCYGAGEKAMYAAGLEGRVFDLFMVVLVILQTYNQQSPFVQLDNWRAFRACTRCQADCTNEERLDPTCHCNRCERLTCRACLETVTDPVTTCSVCSSRLACENCRRKCKHCETFVCLKCVIRSDRVNPETGRHNYSCYNCTAVCANPTCRKRLVKKNLIKGLCKPCRAAANITDDESEAVPADSSPPAIL